MKTLPWREFTADHFSNSETPQIIHAFFDEEDSTEHAHLLSEAEKHLAAHIKNKTVAIQAVITRGVLRRVLGRAAEAEPQTLRFSRNRHNKPSLSHPSGTGFAFNLTHSGNVLLIALSKDTELGMDVEKMDPNRDFSVIAPLVFSHDEQAQYTRAENPVRDFYVLWTAKEALLKAAGCGFAFPANQLPVAIKDGIAAITSLPSGLSAHKKWTLNTFSPGAGYIAALATLSD